MTTITPGRPAAPAEAATPSPATESSQARTARLAQRRKLVVWSLPVVMVLLLVALKLLTMVAFGNQARTAYAAGNITGVQQAGERLGFLNVIEPHKAPFALGDAQVLTGDWDAARARFEEALEVAPTDGLEACQVRVNLVLSLEKLGDAAMAASGLDAAKPFYDRVQAVVGAAPQGCFQPQGEGTGQELNDAKGRAQEKSTPPQDGQDPPPGQDPQTPSDDKQKQLDEKTKDNQTQRSEEQQQNKDSGGGSRPQVDKPW